jgi:hypothetical protein
MKSMLLALSTFASYTESAVLLATVTPWTLRVSVESSRTTAVRDMAEMLVQTGGKNGSEVVG